MVRACDAGNGEWRNVARPSVGYENSFTPGHLSRAVPTVYYVTVNGDRVAGPYESRKEAKREADSRSTNEVNLTYGVESVRE